MESVITGTPAPGEVREMPQAQPKGTGDKAEEDDDTCYETADESGASSASLASARSSFSGARY